MKRFFFILIPFLFFSIITEAQLTRYIVKFKDKGTNPFSLSSPAAYLSQRAVDRRTRHIIAIDSIDLPVTPRYIDSIKNAGAVTVLNISKWLNQVSIQTTDNTAITKISSLSFVQSVSGIAARIKQPDETDKKDKFDVENEITEISNTNRSQNTEGDFFNYGNSNTQITIHNGNFLHNIGLRGQNMTIGMLDGGYQNYTNLKAFDSARINNQILDTWDFVARNAIVTDDIAHGMQCASIIISNIPGQFVGASPKANLLLYRTEDAISEYPIEEHNWASGAERIDSAGGDVISSSLGYFNFDDPSLDYTYSQMDGNTTISVKAADIAASKGILVFNSAGNEGSNAWHYISTPADGDSVLAIGATNGSGIKATFSGFGPSADGRIKPDISSVGQGTTIQTTSNTVGSGNGTSFSCPNMAGLGTCLWQGFPEFNNMKIANALRLSGSRATAPDDSLGYGIPNVKKALVFLINDYSTASGSASGCTNTINWNSKDVTAMKYEIERKLPNEAVFTKVGEKQGTGGTIFSNTSYTYNDILSNSTTGNILYRIKQIIDTAAAGFTFTYTDSVSIAASCTVTATPTIDPNTESVTLIPNPAPSNVILKIKTTDAIAKMPVQVFDINGQLVYNGLYSKPAGTINIVLPLGKLAKGNYTIAIYRDYKLLTTKELIKL